MRYSLYLIICLFFSSFCLSQTVTLKGSVQDSSGQPLESATVYITSAKDSSVVDYTISNKNGAWELKTRKITQPVFLKISFVSFREYKQELQSITEDKDFGIIKLEDAPNELDAVVIESEIPPIRIKSDTLEFNASSFKVRPDANVEALLKQLPGVEVDSDGKITVNGKEVNQILVNGQPFFDKDGKIALQNLPAEIIDKVQVSDTKTKEEELSGQKASGNEASINLTIQEDKNKGLFGKLMGGYGSDKRYESSGLLNYFKNKRRISILASSNNINSTGFSMNEIFDNMGGGRNRSVWMSDNGAFAINGIQFGSDSGITTSGMVGINYSDEWRKGFDGNASYFLNNAKTENANRTRQVNLLPDQPDPDNEGETINNSYVTKAFSNTLTDRFGHNFNSEFEIRPDSTSTISLTPRLTRGQSKTTNTSRQTSTDLNNNLLNESDSNTYGESDNTGFENNIYYYKALKRKGRSIVANFSNENKIDDGSHLNRSTTIFYEDENDDGIPETVVDDRNQIKYNRRIDDRYDLGFEYNEPVLDSASIKVGVNYQWQQSVIDREAYDFDTATGSYTSFNDLLTNYMSSKRSTITPVAGINVAKDKYYMGAELGTEVTSFENFATYLGNNYSLNKNYAFPSARVYGNLKFTKTMSIWASYDFDTGFPSAQEVLPVEDLSNPLYTFVGNPDLNPTQSHHLYFSFRDFDYATRSGYNLYVGGSLLKDQVARYSFIDASAKTTTTYRNVSGTYQGWGGFNWNKSLKDEAHTFKLNFGLSTSFGLEKGFTNEQLYERKYYSLRPRASVNYEYGELLTVNPTYSYEYNKSSYTNYAVGEASNFVHRLNLETTSYWPKHVVFGNDFGYTYNSNIADGFKKDFFLWNSSLGYNFFKEKLLFKVKVYDLLNQNIGTRRTITATTIRDEENMVLRRYVMFSLTFKLEKFGTKEKKESDHFWMW